MKKRGRDLKLRKTMRTRSHIALAVCALPTGLVGVFLEGINAVWLT